jgi:chitodextrinase
MAHHVVQRNYLAVGDVVRDAGKSRHREPLLRAASTAALVAVLLFVGSVPSGHPHAAANLIAGYGFSEGTGTVTADSSGNGLNGTLVSAPAWVAGNTGTGLSFNGSNTYVDLGNPISLQLTGSMTLSAWVYENGNVGDDGQIIAKSDGGPGWQLKSTPDTGVRTYAIAVTNPSGVLTQRYSQTVRALNTWYHVAGVYDAVAQRLDIYVNGVLDNGVLSGTIPSSQGNSPVNANIGRRTGGFNIKGTVDDVRVYGRALTAAEIQADMATPVSTGGSVDITPPTVPTNLTTTPVSPTQINLGWTASTDDVGVTGYRIFRNGTQITTVTTNSYSNTGLAAATTYTYAVAAYDGAGNVSAQSSPPVSATTPAPAFDFAVSNGGAKSVAQAASVTQGVTATLTSGAAAAVAFSMSGLPAGATASFAPTSCLPTCSTTATISTLATTPAGNSTVTVSAIGGGVTRTSTFVLSVTATADTTAPSVSVTAPANNAIVGGAAMTISATASDNVSVAGVQFLLDGENLGAEDTTSPYSIVWNTTTAPGGPHVLSARARDGANNQTTSAAINVVVDNQPPSGSVIINGGAVATNNRTATLTLAASDALSPVTQMRFSNTGTSYSTAEAFATTKVWTLASGTGSPKTVYVQVKDAVGNWSGALTDTIIWDATAPTVSSVSATNVTNGSATINWLTNEAATSQVEYGLTTAYGQLTALDSALITPHTMTLTGLAQQTTYNYRVRSKDAAGNERLGSNLTFKTTGVDLTPPSAPGGLAGTTASSSQIDLAWSAATDNVAVTAYQIERCVNAGCANFALLTTLPPTARAFSDQSLAASTTYLYRARAADAAGNISTPSNLASATTAAPDTENPSAPGTLSTTAVTGTQINLSWGAATDNVGVVGYRVERCEGVGCTVFQKFGFLVTTTSYTDSGLNTDTSYSYIVRAQDAAGNLGDYSNASTATTPATNPSLVAAYSFDEGTGANVTDVSGHGNNGTAANTSWTFGKFGRALSFNGTSGKVTIPDSASLHLSTGMTLEAWVKPIAPPTADWRDIIYKGNDNYYLESTTTPFGNPAAAGLFGGANGAATAPAALPVNVWSHLAATYDSIMLRLYLNGTQVAAIPQTGNIFASTNPLQIGGDNIYGQYFEGLIDEVRVYSTALSPNQIQSDMRTSVGGVLPVPSFSSDHVDFGSQPIGTVSAPTRVTLTNTGLDALSISSIDITGGQALDFTKTSTCGSTLAAGASCPIDVSFAPVAGGARSAFLSIVDNATGSPHAIPLTGQATGFALSPSMSVLTPSQTQQIIVSGVDPATVTWSVDGLIGGSSGTGTISSIGLYQAPASGGAGSHTISATAPSQANAVTAIVSITTHTGVFTHHNDKSRTGLNPAETVLTTNNVKSASFGRLFSYQTDGIAHASPLYVRNVSIPGLGPRNVVYVATEHDSVYAFDADGGQSAPIWHVSFINPAANITSVPNGDTDECCDLTPEIGITGTPVIDPASNTLYVVAKTKENATYRQRLHALDLATGAEKFGGPVLIQASIAGSGVGSNGGTLSLDPLRENQRTALVLHNGIIYFGFGSHGDYQPYHGWLLGYNATTLQQVLAYSSTRNGEGGGIWQSGGGLTIDAAGNFFFATGDGTYNGSSGGADFGDSFLRLNTSGVVQDYFTPHDQGTLNNANLDLNAGGMILLPDQPGLHPHLLVSAGKNGSIYLVDRDNMSGYHTTDGNVQTLPDIFPYGTPLPGNYSSPAYFNGTVYFAPVADTLQAFKLINGLLSTTPTSTSPQTYAYPGGAIAVSANGTSNGILWAVRKNGAASGVLHAYDATNLTNELYNSEQSGSRDSMGAPAAKFSIPLVVNGKVFVATESSVVVFGLLPK